jgi:DNA-directed RNA polymerase specialized sigma24 family protein
MINDSRRRMVDFWSTIYSSMIRRGLGHHDAEDTTQSFFLKLIACELGNRWEREAESDLHLQNLLLRGAAHHCTDEFRRGQRVRRGGGVWHVSVEADDTVQQIACARPNPSEAAELSELQGQMNAAIGEVEQRHAARGRGAQFATALPHVLEEKGSLSQREAARKLCLRESGFRALLFRLRRELAGELHRSRAA